MARPTDYYDLSNVNANTIGLKNEPLGSSCGAPSCSISDIRSLCTASNQLESLPSDALTCIDTDGTREFKAACPSAYSYIYDDATSTSPCPCAHGTNYNVIFCQ